MNGFNLGRYWPAVGPQITLYVPANAINSTQGDNKLVLFELDDAPCESPEDCYVEFLATPMINGPVSPMTGDKKMKEEVKLFNNWTSKYGEFMPGDVKTEQETLELLKAWA